MNKKLLTLAVAAAMVAPLAVQAAGTGPTVYGVAHVAVESIDDDANTDTKSRVNSRQSTLGFKGSEDLGNGLSAIYKMEFQVDQDGSNDDTGYGLQDNASASRNSYVGLAHKDFGTIILGRHDNPIKMMTISRDQFNTTLGDWNEVAAASGVAGNMAGANRDNNVILYKSPNFNGFEAVGMVNPGESDAADGIDDDLASIGARYVNGPIYVGAGWEDRDSTNGALGADSQESWRIAASYDIAGFRVSGMYNETENVGMVKNVDADTWQLALSYKFGNTVVKGMYQDGEEDQAAGSDQEYDAFALGVDHNFSKRTRVYAVYTETSVDTTGMNADVDAFGAGIVHKF